MRGEQGIPELDGAVRGSAAGGEQAALVGTPGDGFDGGTVLAPFEGRLRIELLPDHELVVVAAGRELAVVAVPPQPAHLLLVADELAEPLVRLSNVAVID